MTDRALSMVNLRRRSRTGVSDKLLLTLTAAPKSLPASHRPQHPGPFFLPSLSSSQRNPSPPTTPAINSTTGCQHQFHSQKPCTGIHHPEIALMNGRPSVTTAQVCFASSLSSLLLGRVRTLSHCIHAPPTATGDSVTRQNFKTPKKPSLFSSYSTTRPPRCKSCGRDTLGSLSTAFTSSFSSVFNPIGLY